MGKKIRIAGLCLVVLIIIAAFSAMSYAQSNTIANVEKSEITGTSDKAVSLSWKKVSAADGYYIYSAPADSKDFVKSAQIKDSKITEGVVKGLEQASNYKFYVTAYKTTKQEAVESKEFETLTACTRPEKQKLEKLDTQTEGKLTVSWTINSEAAGYQIQLVAGNGKDFSAAKTIEIKDKATSSYTFNKLKVNKTYSARARTYIINGKERINGRWSNIESGKVQEKPKMPKGLDKSKPMIALTFDDGPGYNKSSDKILDVLEKYNARATFFMVGQNAKDHPKNLKRKVKLGCELGNHTWNHNHYGGSVTASDIKKCSSAIYKITGQYPTAFRSPGGQTTSVIRKECKAENMPLYYWSLDTQDWKYRNADHVYKAVMNNVRDGDIILMHEIYDSTADAVEKMVPALIKKGYQLVTCEELVIAKTGKKPKPGTQYLDAKTVKNETY